jgi:hypothetical protein
LNVYNKLCDKDGNELVFVVREVDTSTSDSGYLNLNADVDADVDAGVGANTESDIKLKKWIINAIKL